MPNRVISWPEGFGFHIYGDGPSYVVSVEKDSDAGRSGLQAGDQILQLNEHNVGDLSSERIKELVSGLAFPPLPSLGVVSKLRKVALVGRSSVYNLYGLTLSGTLPVIISHVEPFSSASQANVKENDVLIKVDDKYVTSHTQARNILRKSCRCGGANICIISTYKATDAPLQLMSSITEDISEVTLSTGHTKAYDFVSKMKRLLKIHPFEIQNLVKAIKVYSKQRDIEKFATKVARGFQHIDEGQKLAQTLKYFIPNNHKGLYEYFIQEQWDAPSEKTKHEDINYEYHNAFLQPGSCCDIQIQDNGETKSSVACTRSVTIFRGRYPLGLTIYGYNPVVIQAVINGSPASNAGLQSGDRILSLNGIDLRTVSHTKAVQLIQGSGSMPTLVIQSKSSTLPKKESKMPCLSDEPSSVNLADVSFPFPYVPPKTNYDTQLLGSRHSENNQFKVPTENKNNGDRLGDDKRLVNNRLVEKEKIESLLTAEEGKAFRHALTEFFDHRIVDTLLFQIYPILRNRDNGCDDIWEIVFHYLNNDERNILKKKLSELTGFDLHEHSNISKTTDRQIKQSYTTERCSEECSTSPSSANEANKVTHTQSPLSSATTKTKRYRRRRTVDSIIPLRCDGTPSKTDTTDISHNNYPTPKTTVVNISEKNDDTNFYNYKQQLERRRRRELLNPTRRQRSVGAITGSTTLNNAAAINSNVNDSDDFSREISKMRQLGNGKRMRQRLKTIEVCTKTTSTTEELTTYRPTDRPDASFTHSNRYQCGGDKQKSSKKKQKQAVDATIPSTSVDDAINKDKTVNGSDNLQKSGPILQGQPNNNNVDHATQSNMQTDKKQNPVRRGDVSSIPVTLTYGTIENESIEDKTDSTNIENTKDSTGTNDDSLKHTRSYLNSLKKRLTFSRPPKTNDTDTFLCELSAQFDKEMNLLDDIEIVEEEDKTDFKFGEKWSYLPKNDQSISTSSRMIQQASLDEFIQNTESNQTANNVTHPEKPPLIESRSSPNVVLQQGQEKPSGNRDSRVRRRRRRNLDNASNGVEGQSQTTAQDDMTSRRISLPAPALNFLSCAEQPVCYEDDKVIYDVPKPTATQRRAHVNVEKRSRRSRAKRSMSTAAKRNSSEIRMHVWTENDDRNLSSANSVDYPVKMRSSSPTDQVSFFDRAKKKNYRVSGISMNMEDVFSAAEEDLQKDDRRLSMPPVETPPLPLELEVAPSGKQDLLQDPDDVYAPLHQEVLALGLAYEEEEEEYQAPQTSSQQNKQNGELLSIPPPPPPPPVPPTIPPPPPISPPLMFKNTPPTSPRKMSVKRINWEKIEPVDLGNTVWGQLGEDHDTINDVVKYLDLEEHFALKKAKNLKLKKTETKKDAISILAHKKAYNTSILLAHLKLSHREICNCLLFNGHESLRNRMEASHYHQLLMYAPDVEETKQLQAFNGNLEKLNEADFLAVKLINIPGYQIRLQALAFKHGFTEKEEEIRKNLEIIQRASLQLRKSRKLAKILEFVLAMGNYMNRGNIRISKATGFRVQFLAEMDSTKTSDNKLTFLHILARAVTTKFPDVVIFSEELMDVKNASRVIYNAVLEDLQELRKIWLYIRDNLNETACKNKEDRFKIAMETCLVRTNGSLKRLEQLRKATVKEFNKTAQYFGENPKKIGMQQFFKIFEEFTRKFEKSHNEIRHLARHKSKSFVK